MEGEAVMMIGEMLSNLWHAIVNPVREELRSTEKQTLKRIQEVLWNAEKEVASEGHFMTPKQRLQAAEMEIKKAEEQLLSALSSVFKALCYVAPQINPRHKHLQIKEIEGKVVEQVQTQPSKLNLLFNRKK